MAETTSFAVEPLADRTGAGGIVTLDVIERAALRETVHGILLGRFQPLQNGHVDVLDKLIRGDLSLVPIDMDRKTFQEMRVGWLTIVVVDVPEPMENNPLTVAERREAWGRVLRSRAPCSSVMINVDWIPGEASVPNHFQYLRTVVEGPKPLVIFTDNQKQIEWARRTNFRALYIRNRSHVDGDQSATFVRQAMASGQLDLVRQQVPLAAYQYYMEIGLPARIRRLMNER